MIINDSIKYDTYCCDLKPKKYANDFNGLITEIGNKINADEANEKIRQKYSAVNVKSCYKFKGTHIRYNEIIINYLCHVNC